MYKIFLVEDDHKLKNYIKTYLEAYDFEVELVKDYANIEEEFLESKADLVLLDINLPYFDGFYFCKRIRKHSTLPIIFVSARNDDLEQIRAMELGGDDYIIKPFNVEFLLTKINVLVRRTYGDYNKARQNLSHKTLHLDGQTYKLDYKGRQEELSKNEFKLIQCFMKNPDQVISREDLLKVLWDEDVFVDYNTLTVNITRVKKRLKNLGLEDLIKNKRGVGYVFESNY